MYPDESLSKPADEQPIYTAPKPIEDLCFWSLDVRYSFPAVPS